MALILTQILTILVKGTATWYHRSRLYS